MSLLIASAPAMALAPFLAPEDVRSCAPLSGSSRDAFAKDSLWRQLLVSHFRPALQHVRSSDNSEDNEQTLLRQIVGARQVYAQLAATSPQPFVLEPRARLVLEINELRDWNKHQQKLLLQRQAEVVARSFQDQEAMQRLHEAMVPETLELIALQALVAGGGKVDLHRANFDLHGMAWSPAVEQDLMQILARRAEGRRAWLRQQRDFLQQDLSFNWN